VLYFLEPLAEKSGEKAVERLVVMQNCHKKNVPALLRTEEVTDLSKFI
jgi:hypothetical protein